RLVDVDLKGQGRPQVSPDALDAARRLMPGADAYALLAEWQAWWATSGRPTLRAPDAAFLGWVKKRAGLRAQG
ncbi:MAG: replication initiator protein A, partial [Ruegeria sp.]